MKYPIAVRVDQKGRLTIPAAVRAKLAIQPGTIFFLQNDGSFLHLARAVNPFDALAGQAFQEYRQGQTRSLQEFAEEEGIPPDGE